MSKNNESIAKAPIRWQGILFAIAANLLFVTIAGTLLNTIIILVAAALAGIVTNYYVGKRSGTHAFIGGLISIPLLGIFILTGNWPLAILSGAFCALGGLLTDLGMRRRAV